VELTPLPALLLFLADGKSGYDIRVLFQASPIGIFSDSPGAIYAALKRLGQAALIETEAQPTGRRRRVNRRTSKGEAALRAWLRAPIQTDTVARKPQELDLRYTLIAVHLGKREACRFLDDCASAYDVRIAELQAFLDDNGNIGAPSLDALRLGIEVFRTRLRWCHTTRKLWENER
jgi:DNA-binding PadR family transcriptional regulator